MGPQRRKVVVTGLGMITPLGGNVHDSWKAILSGKSGIRKIQQELLVDTNSLPCKVWANCLIETEKGGTKSRFISLALKASEEALKDAQWPPPLLSSSSSWEPWRTGVSIGSGIGSMEDIVTSSTLPYRKISPFFVPRLLVNMASGHVSIHYNFQGPNISVSTACATGAHSIGEAARLIEYGDADVMVCGGSESTMNSLAIAGFSRAKALATKYNDSPEISSRPFDSDRDGFVMGEGCGIMILEEYEHAIRRNAPQIYCELQGYGLSGDAHHITSPSESGRGALICMQSALRNALRSADGKQVSIGYVNAHATSTPIGDIIEAKAIGQLINGSCYVSSTKGATGHLLGAAGAVEAIFSVLSIRDKIIPMTLNLNNPDPELPKNLKFVSQEPIYEPHLHGVMSNSFGFGGTNTSLIFTRI